MKREVSLPPRSSGIPLVRLSQGLHFYDFSPVSQRRALASCHLWLPSPAPNTPECATCTLVLHEGFEKWILDKWAEQRQEVSVDRFQNGTG